jgi:hypothetical protein
LSPIASKLTTRPQKTTICFRWSTILREKKSVSTLVFLLHVVTAKINAQIRTPSYQTFQTTMIYNIEIWVSHGAEYASLALSLVMSCCTWLPIFRRNYPSVFIHTVSEVTKFVVSAETLLHKI